MRLRTVGVEEELLLVDPRTGSAVDGAPAVLEAAEGRWDRGTTEFTEPSSGDLPPPGGTVEHELQQQQIEIDTVPHTSMRALAGELRTRRRRLADLAEGQGTAVAALASFPLAVQPTAFPDDRYEQMVDLYGPTGREQLVCGTHVHVSTGAEEEAVAVLDRIRVWLPVLLALSANSPYWQGRDTAYESFRSSVWSRWPTAGPTRVFGSFQGYRGTVEAVLRTGAVLDDGMIYWDARLGRGYPTVEIRVADVCTDAADAVLVAACCRALVETAARDWRGGRPAPDVSAELLRLAAWRAGRSGTTDELVHPTRLVPRPCWSVVQDFREHLDGALRDSGDAGLVDDRLDAIRTNGTGSTAQRRAFDKHGRLDDVVLDAVERTLDT